MSSTAAPEGWLRPNSVDEVVRAIKSAAENSTAIQLRGVVPADVPVQRRVTSLLMDDYKAVVDYPARDMTITVQAGLHVCELNRILAEEGHHAINHALQIHVHLLHAHIRQHLDGRASLFD